LFLLTTIILKTSPSHLFILQHSPVGIATQKDNLRRRLVIRKSAENLANFLNASVHLMQVLARACGHDDFSQFCVDDLTTWKRDIAYLTGVKYAGVVPL
jgi:glutamate synthase domain-containing protein 2